MSKVRASLEELQAQIADVQSQLDALSEKAASETGLTAEEQAQYEALVTQLEDLKSQESQASAEARYAAIKARDTMPRTPAPKLWATARKEEPAPNYQEALGLWIRHKLDPMQPLNADEQLVCARSGFSLMSDTARLPCNWNSLNYRQRALNRTVLSTGGAGTGAEWTYQTYSNVVTEYITYQSPLLGMLKTETTADGNSRDYKIVDRTAMRGVAFDSETAPTIPERNMVSAKVAIKPKSVTTGFQKVSMQELRDSAISIGENAAKADAEMKAYEMEYDFINATGNGTTDVQGLVSVANSAGTASESAFGETHINQIYFSVAPQYRKNAIWLYNDNTSYIMYDSLVDSYGRSLFDKNVVDGVEWDVLKGKRAVVSELVPDNMILFFNPDHYQVRLIEGNTFQIFTERFWPTVGYAGHISYGAAYVGPNAGGANCTVKKFTLTS